MLGYDFIYEWDDYQSNPLRRYTLLKMSLVINKDNIVKIAYWRVYMGKSLNIIWTIT